MMNEFIFCIQSLVCALGAVCALGGGLAALVAFVCVQCILANLFVLKQITILGLSGTCADAFTIGATLGLNLLQEYYGKDIAKKTIFINFFLLVFYGCMSGIHLWYIPAAFDTSHLHYQALLTPMPRIIIASLTAFLISQLVDYYTYGFLKTQFQGRYLVMRNYGSTLISQGIDTILFSFLGLYGIVDSVFHIIALSYTIKIIAIICAVPVVACARSIVSLQQK